MSFQPPQPHQIRLDLVDPSFALHVCAVDGSLRMLHQALSSNTTNIDLDFQHDKWGTPLHVAVWTARPTAVEALLMAGANPLTLNYGGGSGDHDPEWSPLSLAAALGHRDILKSFLQRLPRESVMEHSEYRWCPLIWAAIFGNVSTVEDLFIWQPLWPQSILDEALIRAAHRWQIHVVRILTGRFKFHQSVLEQALISAAVYQRDRVFDPRIKELPLSACDFLDQRASIELLIDAGASPNTQLHDKDHILPEIATPLSSAGALEALLGKGADPNGANRNGITALHYLGEPVMVDGIHGSRSALHETGIRLLLSHGASVTKRGLLGDTPLHVAAYGCRSDIFRLYLSSCCANSTEERALLNGTVNDKGDTLLHFAAAGANVEAVEHLLAQGLDANAQNENGWSPLICALVNSRRTYSKGVWRKKFRHTIEVGRRLLSSGASASVVTREGWTPLHCLASRLDEGLEGHGRDLAELLITAGADPKARAPLMTKVPPTRVGREEEEHHWGWRPRRLSEDPGGQPEGATSPGRLVIHWAAEFGALGVLSALVAHGKTSTFSSDSEDPSPAMVAAESKLLRPEIKQEIFDLLIHSGYGF